MNPTPNPQFPSGTPPKTDGLATASLILGVLSFLCLSVFAGIPAIICGHISRGKIARSGGTLTGGGLALTGAILGYLSVIILIGTVVVMVRVMPTLQAKTAKPVVETAQTRIATACAQYRADFGKLPALPPIQDEQVDTSALIGTLGGKNPNGTSYYESSGNGIHVNGLPTDVWGHALNIGLDLNDDGMVTVKGQNLPATVIVWSSGPNGVNEFGTGDDVTGW